MPETLESQRNKKIVLTKLKNLFPDLKRTGAINRFMFKSKNSDCAFYLTFASKESLFYDINEFELNELELSKNGFFCVLIGGADTCLFFPAGDVRNQISEFISQTDGQHYKFHLKIDNTKYSIKELPKLNIMKYFNNFSIKVDL